MSYGSFYGGRQGNSFVLVKSYPDVPSMVADFKKGNNFSQVKYDEYVIINAYNKNNGDNGKIFRRGYDYNNNSNRKLSYYKPYKIENGEEVEVSLEDDLSQSQIKEALNGAYYKFSSPDNGGGIDAGGAIYIATIVGPQGKSPILQLGSYGSIPEGSGTGFSDGEMSVTNESLVPGIQRNENGEIKKNNVIKWRTYSTTDEQRDQGVAKIGLQIPYPVIEPGELNTNPYTETDNIKITEDETSKDDPFYYKWNFTIPAGKHGTQITQIKKIRVDEISSYETVYGIVGENEVALTNTNFRQAPFYLEENESFLAYKLVSHENETPEEKLYFIGKYKQIDSIKYNENNGKLFVLYTDNYNDNNVLEEQEIGVFPRLKKLSYNDNNNGILKIEFNAGKQVSVPIKYIDKVKLEENGLLTYKTNIEDDDALDAEGHQLGKIKWIQDISYDQESNKIIITYNTTSSQNDTVINDTDEIEVPFVANLKVSQDGTIWIKYNGNDTEWIPMSTELSEEPDVAGSIKWIDNIQYDVDNDQMLIYYNNDEIDSESQKIPGTVINNPFNKIRSVNFYTNLQEIDEEYEPGPGFLISYGDGTTESIPFSGGRLINRIELVKGTNSETENPTEITQIYYAGSNEDPSELNFTYPYTIKTNDNNIGESHQIQFFNNKGELMVSSSPITGIASMKIQDNNLLVLYNNSQARSNVKNPVTDSNNYVWENLGLVRANSGLLIGENILPSTIVQGVDQELSIQGIIDYLRGKYSNGMNGGLNKVVTVGEEYQNKKFFGYNEESKDWYFLGSIPQAVSQLDCVCGTMQEFTSPQGESKKGLLSTGGLYFIIEGEDDITEEEDIEGEG